MLAIGILGPRVEPETVASRADVDPTTTERVLETIGKLDHGEASRRDGETLEKLYVDEVRG